MTDMMWKCVQTLLQEILDWGWKLCQAKVSRVMNKVSKRFFSAIVKIYGAKVDWGSLLRLLKLGYFPMLYLKQPQLVRYNSNSMSLPLRMLITIDWAHFLLLKQTIIQERTTPNPCATTLMSQRYQTVKIQFQYLILLRTKNLSCLSSVRSSLRFDVPLVTACIQPKTTLSQSSPLNQLQNHQCNSRNIRNRQLNVPLEVLVLLLVLSDVHY